MLPACLFNLNAALSITRGCTHRYSFIRRLGSTSFIPATNLYKYARERILSTISQSIDIENNDNNQRDSNIDASLCMFSEKILEYIAKSSSTNEGISIYNTPNISTCLLYNLTFNIRIL